MISWPKYSIGRAEDDFEKLTIDNIVQTDLAPEFEKLRHELIIARNDIFDNHGFDNGIVDKYTFDLELGMAIYEILRPHLSNRDLYLDDVWMFLSVRVIPDIVHSRWNLDGNRFYGLSRRIYLKQIWWYVHLAWNTDKITTYEILKNNSTDTIQAMVERPGLGYNIELYKEIIRQYAQYDGIKRNERRLLLRRVMVLNTAREKTIAPELVEGGLEKYVYRLYKDVI